MRLLYQAKETIPIRATPFTSTQKKVQYSTMNKRKVVDPKNARTDTYRDVLRTIAKHGKCPFCLKHFTYHKNPVLLESGSWFITKAQWPYKNAKHHFLIISRKHVEQITDLKTDDFVDLGRLVQWAVKRYRLRGGGLAGRFGDTKHTGATVCHLHFHLIVPDKKKGHVNFPIG